VNSLGKTHKFAHFAIKFVVVLAQIQNFWYRLGALQQSFWSSFRQYFLPQIDKVVREKVLHFERAFELYMWLNIDFSTAMSLLRNLRTKWQATTDFCALSRSGDPFLNGELSGVHNM
jgi:hypothetical protein